MELILSKLILSKRPRWPIDDATLELNDNEMKLLEKDVELISLKRPIDTAMPPPITITTSLRSRLLPCRTDDINVFINHSGFSNMYRNTITITEMVRLQLCRPSTVMSMNSIRALRGKTTSNANVFPVKHKTSTNTNVFVKFKFLNRNMNIDVFNVVFKTILTNNAMKLMENEDVEPFSHFDVVFKTILTDNAEDVVFKTILKDVLVDNFVNTKVNTSKRPISISPILNVKI